MMEAAVYAAAYVSFEGSVPVYGLIADAHAFASQHVEDWREATREQHEREIREDADQA
jgi:hypothetical protein